MEDNFLSGFLAWLKLLRENTFHPGRHSPHYTKSDSNPVQHPPCSLHHAGLGLRKSSLPKFRHRCFDCDAVTLSSFLSSLWSLCFLNHAALGRSKGTVRILLLISFPRPHRVCVARCMMMMMMMPCVVCDRDAAGWFDPSALCSVRFLSVLNRSCGQCWSFFVCLYKEHICSFWH